uniref:Uncharacterized protein n=1 Tax=Rousettus aegyptiacus TaxID=9407 RepID=A0A7J8HRG0_ROUAE|nr:hypothetical protein HJG63_011065 [Rousettus aegyptiacus]
MLIIPTDSMLLDGGAFTSPMASLSLLLHLISAQHRRSWQRRCYRTSWLSANPLAITFCCHLPMTDPVPKAHLEGQLSKATSNTSCSVWVSPQKRSLSQGLVFVVYLGGGPIGCVCVGGGGRLGRVKQGRKRVDQS